MSPPQELSFTDWDTDTASSTDVDIQGDTFTLDTTYPINDIANFESGALDASFAGDTTNWAVNSTSPVISGTNSLKEQAPDTGAIWSASGLPRYPQQDENFAGYIYPDGPGIPELGWGVQDNASITGYFFGAIPATDEILLSRFESGTRNELTGRVSVSLSEATWYDLDVEWLSDGSITGRIYSVDQSTGARQSELASISATDTTYASGGLGFEDGSTTGTVVFDNYRILGEL